MKKTIAILPVLVVTIGLFLKASLVSADSAIAVVNGEEISQAEFQKNWNSYLELEKKLLAPGQMTPQWEAENKRLLLNQMLEQRLLLQEAKRRKIEVDKSELKAGLAQVKQRFQVDAKDQPLSSSEADKAFRAQLNKENLSEKQFESRIESELRVVKLTNQLVKDRVKRPTEEQVQALFEVVKERIGQAAPLPSADPQQADMDAIVRNARAKVNESVRFKHIMFAVSPNASAQERKAVLNKAKDVRARIEKGADFEEMAKEFSDDAPTAKNGGEVGTIVRGQMVRDFEEIVFALPLGSISRVVKTKLGYHIIQVEEKKAASKLHIQDVRADLVEYLLRLAARQEYSHFLGELRKSASIDVRAGFMK